MNRRNSSREGSAKTDPSLYFPHISRVESLREFLSPESFFGFLSLSPVGAASRSCLRCGPQPAGDAQKQLRSLQAYRLFLQRVDAAFPLPERGIHALKKKAVSLEAAQLFLGITRRLWAAAEA